MGLNIKNAAVERLAADVARFTGETKTEAIRVALQERQTRLRRRSGGISKRERLEKVLREKIWPAFPKAVLGQQLLKREREKILGIGPAGF